MIDGIVQKHVEVAEKLAAQGNQLGALVAYRQAYEVAAQGSSLAGDIHQRISLLETELEISGSDSSGETAANVRVQPPENDLGANARMGSSLKGVSRTSLLGPILLAFLAVGVLIFVISVAAGGWVTQIGQSVNGSWGFGAGQAMGAGGLAVLAGLVQVWVFRHRIHGGQRFAFILSTALGGVLGGLAAGALLTAGEKNALIIGGLIGLVAGAVSSLAQNFLMKSHGTALPWFLWSTFTWMMVWASGWYASWAVDGTLGFALGAAIILVLIGLSLTLFLIIQPQIEF